MLVSKGLEGGVRSPNGGINAAVMRCQDTLVDLKTIGQTMYWLGEDAIVLNTNENVNSPTNNFGERAALQDGTPRVVSLHISSGLLNIKLGRVSCDLLQSKTS